MLVRSASILLCSLLLCILGTGVAMGDDTIPMSTTQVSPLITALLAFLNTPGPTMPAGFTDPAAGADAYILQLLSLFPQISGIHSGGQGMPWTVVYSATTAPDPSVDEFLASATTTALSEDLAMVSGPADALAQSAAALAATISGIVSSGSP